MRAVVLVCLLFGAIPACGAGNASNSAESPEPDPTLGWPKEAKALLAHLNTWDHVELEAYERPDLDLDKHLCAQTGDVGEWIELHKKKLTALGVSVRGNRDARVSE